MLIRLSHPLRNRMRALARLVRGVGVPAEMTERLLLDQASDFSYVISAIALLGLSTISLIYFDFLHEAHQAARDTAMASISLCYLVILQHANSWLRAPLPTGAMAKIYISKLTRILFMLGTFWCCLLVPLVHSARPTQLDLLFGIMAGCLATPVMVAPAICAFAYWLPVSIGIFISVCSSRQTDLFVMVDLFSFIGLTGFCIFYLNSRMIERAIGAIRLEENAEVIRLLLRDFEESASDWLWETDAQLRLQQVSQRLMQVARRPVQSFQGTFPGVLLGEEAMREPRPGTGVERLLRAIAERSPFRDLVVPVTVEGEERFWSLTGKPILDKAGRFAGYHGVGSDITGQRRQQEQISFLAKHDSLTKLANRVLFSEVLHQCCDKAEQTGFALLCLDLDNFKIINDSLGHATGDAVLVAVAERLRGSIREFDIAARLGGDEFAVVVITADQEEARAIAGRIVERIMRPFHFDGQLVQIGISVGVAMAPMDGATPTSLMKNADLALYRAKNDGRGIVRMYDPAMDEAMQGRRALQAALRRAVSRGELSVEFQPIVDLLDGRVVAAEALVRWHHPERGPVPPAEFVPLAEEGGLIGELGEFVLRTACAAAANWPVPVGIAVNLSPLQLRDRRIVNLVTEILGSSGLGPGRLELEIVESTMLEANSQAEGALWQLHEQGVRIALDDFGTGYSSLSYLRRFPFDKIKIDRSFIRDLGYEKDDSSIILAIIGLAERMNMVVTAEGVETEEQADLLRSYGCAQAQGFLYHRPMSGAAFAAMLGEAPPRLASNARTGVIF